MLGMQNRAANSQGKGIQAGQCGDAKVEQQKAQLACVVATLIGCLHQGRPACAATGGGEGRGGHGLKLVGCTPPQPLVRRAANLAAAQHAAISLQRLQHSIGSSLPLKPRGVLSEKPGWHRPLTFRRCTASAEPCQWLETGGTRSDRLSPAWH